MNETEKAWQDTVEWADKVLERVHKLIVEYTPLGVPPEEGPVRDLEEVRVGLALKVIMTLETIPPPAWAQGRKRGQ